MRRHRGLFAPKVGRSCWVTLLALAVVLGLHGLAPAADDPVRPEAEGTRRVKRALIVGNSRYFDPNKNPPRWPRLLCSNEVDRLKEVLVRYHGFCDGDVRLLKDATKRQIVETFEEHLIGKSKPGDVAYFHFSGHGQLIADPTGRKLSGLRPSLVPIDYITASAEDGARTNLRSDEMNRLLHQLKGRMERDGRVVGNITVTLDACFSGTGTRGTPARGRGWDPDVDGLPPPPSPKADDPDNAFYPREEAFAEGYVAISACRPDQLARAMIRGNESTGIFTGFLTEQLARDPGDLTYRALHDRLWVDVQSQNHDQWPQIEGEIDKRIFDGAVIRSSPYLLVSPDTEGAPDTISLPVGRLQGGSVGSKFALFARDADVSDPRAGFAEAGVCEVFEVRCRARLTQPYRGKVLARQFEAARAIETLHVYGESRIRTYFAPGVPRADLIRGIDVFEDEGVGPTDYDVRLDRLDDGRLTVQKNDGRTLMTVHPDDFGSYEAIRQAVLDLWRYRFVAQLRNEATRDAIGIELIPVVPTKFNERGEVIETRDREPAPTPGGTRTFEPGEFVMIRLRNRSPQDLFVTVLALTTDGRVGPIFPHPKARAPEGPIPHDGVWHRIGLPFVFQLGEAGEAEIYKVIATSEPADFSGLMSPETESEEEEELLAKMRGVSNPLGLLLRSTKTGRWTATRGVPPFDWATAEVCFDIQPAPAARIPR